MRFLDMFLMHCLLSDSPPDTPAEIAELARNQHRTAARGREPGLELERAGRSISLVDWARELLEALAPIAERLDAALGGHAHVGAHAQALAEAAQRLDQPDTLPSARVMQAIQGQHGGSFIAFAQAKSLQTQQTLLGQPLSAAERERLTAQSQASVTEQKRIESLDSLPFEIYRQQYTSPDRLGRPHQPALVEAQVVGS